MGIENIYEALSNQQGVGMRWIASEVFTLSEDDLIAAQTLDVFLEMFGQVAVDFVLCIGGFDGLYIGWVSLSVTN